MVISFKDGLLTLALKFWNQREFGQENLKTENFNFPFSFHLFVERIIPKKLINQKSDGGHQLTDSVKTDLTCGNDFW